MFAALLHKEGVVVAQRGVDHKANEITEFRGLPEDVDLDGVVVTADVLSRCRDNASYADLFVMPMWRAVAADEVVTALARSA